MKTVAKMEIKENLSQSRLLKKPRSTLTRKVSNSSEQSVQENTKKTNPSTPKKNESVKAEDKKEEKDTKSLSRTPLSKRPSTVSSERRTKSVEKEQPKSSVSVPKTSSKPTKNPNFASSSITSKTKKLPEKAKFKLLQTKFEIPFPESDVSGSLLTVAVQEEQQVQKMVQIAREQLQKNLMERNRNKSKGRDPMGDCAMLFVDSFLNLRTLNSFGDSYSSTLDEMFQVWMNLFYFIVNLRINLIRVLTVAGTEKFEPNLQQEKNVVTQAMECVKLFSKLKLKSLSNLSDAIDCSESNLTEEQIKDYVEKTSAPFLNDLNFMEKKAKELLKQVLNTKEA